MRLFYSDDYTSMSHSIDANKKSKWINESLTTTPIKGVVVDKPPPVNLEHLKLAHSISYINAVKTGNPLELAESSTFPWDANVWESELVSCGGMMESCNQALVEGLSGTLSCGFHHSSRERGRSHCVFNGLAISILALQQAGVERILHIDLDAHCGGGTHSLAGDLAGYHQLDVSLFPTDKFNPVGSSTLDIVEKSSDYLTIINRRLNDLGDKLDDFQICLYYAGMDPHEGSAYGGLPGIDSQMLLEREELIFSTMKQCNIPCAFALGGGYIGPGLNKEGLVSLHRSTIEIAQNFASK